MPQWSFMSGCRRLRSSRSRQRSERQAHRCCSTAAPHTVLETEASQITTGGSVTVEAPLDPSSSTCSSSRAGTMRTCIWQFGDGVVETGAQVSHSYIHSGTYQVKLTVIDEDGLADDDTAPLLVMSVPTADLA